MQLKILKGDNIELLKAYPNNYFDSVVTDCPYGLGREPDALKLLQDWIITDIMKLKAKASWVNHGMHLFLNLKPRKINFQINFELALL